jgi:hypothetical protein
MGPLDLILNRSVGTFYMLCNPINLKRDFYVNENIIKQSLEKILWKKLIKNLKRWGTTIYF